ncbi:restriction endonuclease subunit S [Oribacterium sp. NK2B42]|uniref:restriction endonuclease subunit S n=1 Tax=Oribacterium sp. NK2B42 TaxID=689781 RepID=UPI0003F6CAA8|nr:restriction endonuclease subunit S [Oribacterium sp. NK2B42]
MEYRLDEIFDLQMGKTPSRNNPEYWDSEDNKWISIADLSKCGKYIEETKEYLSDKAVNESGISLIPANTVIMSFKLSIGKTAITPEPMYSNEAIMSFRDKHVVELLPDYIYYMFSGKNWEEGTNKAVMGKTLNKATLSSVKISIHDIVKQHEIVEVLDKLSSVIDNRQQELEKLDELIKARFVELFEDGESPIKTVEELCSEIVDCPHTTPKYEGELKNPAIRTSEIKKGYIIWDSMRYVSDEEYEERVSRLRPEAGDIVYGREGTFGNAAVLPEGYKFCLGQRVMLLRPDYTKCTSEYLLHAVISDDVYRQAVGKNNASTVAHVNVKDVKQFRIPLPSFDKQNQFADFVKQVDKSKVVVQKSLDETQKLFDSLMQQYFG